VPLVEPQQPALPAGNEPAHRGSLAVIALAFLGWGVLRALNDIVVAANQVQYPHHDAAAMSIHVSFFAAYLLVPIPISAAMQRIGLRAGVTASAAIMGLSALVCAVSLRSQLGFPYLVSLSALAVGVAILQTAGNPAATLLGPPATGAQRLLVVQSAMSLGAAIAPFMMGMGRSAATLDPTQMFAGVRVIYLTTGLLLLALTVASLFTAPIGNVTARVATPDRAALRTCSRYAIAAVFLFVGTEANVLTHVLQFRRLTSVAGGAFLWTVTLSGYWIFITIGRLLSSSLLRRANLVGLLRLSALLGAMLVMLALLLRGGAATLILLLTGLVNAAIFPFIFSLSTAALSQQELTAASGRLMTAIGGGAVLPVLSGAIADRVGIRGAFILPIFSYLFIAATASRCSSGGGARVD
jgi:MFS transporter, FHS family, L-fucose permease